MNQKETAETLDQMRTLIDELRQRNAELIEQRDRLLAACVAFQNWRSDPHIAGWGRLIEALDAADFAIALVKR